MADVTIDAGANLPTTRCFRAMVWTSASIGYFFFIDVDLDFKYAKTTDGGATWSGLTTVCTGSVENYDVWFDQWTPGDAGVVIHTWYIEADADDVHYRSLNTSTDTLGTQRNLDTEFGSSASSSTFISGAKMRGGNLLCCFDKSAGNGMTKRSTDGGTTWGARTNVWEASGDFALIFPGNEADNQDAWIIYQDRSANELTLKVHDDSANTNSESSAILSVTHNGQDELGRHPYAGAIRHGDKHLIVAAWTASDSATGDFRTFDINGTASITEKTALATDKDDCYYPCVYVNPSGDIYVGYIGKRDGSETMWNTVGAYYVKSTDGGTTWSSGDTAYSASVTDYVNCWAALNGPRWAMAWRDFSSQALLTNFDNSIAILPKGGGLLTLGVGA